MKLRDENSRPNPPGALQAQHGEEARSSPRPQPEPAMRVQKRAQRIPRHDSDDAGEERTQRSRADAEPQGLVGEHDGFGVDALADEGHDEEERFAEEEAGGEADLFPSAVGDAHVDADAVVALDAGWGGDEEGGERGESLEGDEGEEDVIGDFSGVAVVRVDAEVDGL